MSKTDARDDQTCLGCANCDKLYLSSLSECPYCGSEDKMGDISDQLEKWRKYIKLDHAHDGATSLRYLVGAVVEIIKLRKQLDGR